MFRSPKQRAEFFATHPQLGHKKGMPGMQGPAPMPAMHPPMAAPIAPVAPTMAPAQPSPMGSGAFPQLAQFLDKKRLGGM